MSGSQSEQLEMCYFVNLLLDASTHFFISCSDYFSWMFSMDRIILVSYMDYDWKYELGTIMFPTHGAVSDFDYDWKYELGTIMFPTHGAVSDFVVHAAAQTLSRNSNGKFQMFTFSLVIRSSVLLKLHVPQNPGKRINLRIRYWRALLSILPPQKYSSTHKFHPIIMFLKKCL